MNLLKKIGQYLIDIGIFKMISDEQAIKKQYKKKFNKDLDLENPKTFNEKLQWLKLYDRKDIYKKMVDKYEVKKYVADILGEEYIIPTLGVWDSFEDINFNTLPNKFVLKCTHDSGGVFICKDKNKLNIKKIKIKFKLMMKRNFYYRYREWAYNDVKPRIIAEPYLVDESGCILNDYKIFCFNGEPLFTLVCSNRSKESKNTDFYDNNWNLLSFTREKYKNNPNGIPKPTKLKEMINIARTLSRDIPFIRVDLYNVNDQIYFGELTFYPSGGFEGFNPKEWDEKIGKLLKLYN